MDVGGWLRSLGLGQYEALFRASDIGADILPELSEVDLEKLGVSLGHRQRPSGHLRSGRSGRMSRVCRGCQPFVPVGRVVRCRDCRAASSRSDRIAKHRRQRRSRRDFGLSNPDDAAPL